MGEMSSGPRKTQEQPVRVEKWISCGLPFRPVKGTYGWCASETLPPLGDEARKPFRHLQSLQQVLECATELDKRIQSPTACHVDVDLKTGRFYSDSQGCVHWFFSPECGVYVHNMPHQYDPDKKNAVTVSPTLGEFFARLCMENDIYHAHGKAWFAAGVHTPLGDDVHACCHVSTSESVKDAAAVWKALQAVMSKQQMDYLEGYYKSFTGQRNASIS